MGQMIGAILTLHNETSLDIHLEGALGITCDDEPYTFDGHDIVLTNRDKSVCRCGASSSRVGAGR